VAVAVAAIGATGVAERLTEIAEIVERPPLRPSGTWGEFLESVDPLGRISALEKEIGAQVDDTWALLEAYTLAHLTNSASGDQ
jgi:hypothetical protein